jgi:hypothetical protein
LAQTELSRVRRTIESEIGCKIVKLKTQSAKRWSEESLTFCVAGGHLVRPVAPVGLSVEGQSFWAVEDEASAGDAILELAAIGGVAHQEISVLVGTLVGGLSRLYKRIVSDSSFGGGRKYLRVCSRPVQSTSKGYWQGKARGEFAALNKRPSGQVFSSGMPSLHSMYL